METQEKIMCPAWHLVLFILYSCFGFAVCVLWLYDMIVYQKKAYSISAVILFIIANSYQCYLLYKSVFKQIIIKLGFVLIYLFLLIIGIIIYVSNHHFSIYTVASVITQILFALYGITYIMGNNQKIREDDYLNEISESNSNDIDRSAVYLYNPELPDDRVISYDNADSNISTNCNDSDYDLNEKQKYLYFGIKKEETEIEITDECCHFKYPEQIDVSDDSIAGVVDNHNPYRSKYLELHNVSIFV